MGKAQNKKGPLVLQRYVENSDVRETQKKKGRGKSEGGMEWAANRR